MLFRQIFDEKLAQYAYLIACQKTKEAILVDPERDVDRYLELARREGVEIVAATETHIHADFLSGVRELAARKPNLRVYLSNEGDADWKYLWPDRDGRAWTKLRDGDAIRVGNIELRVVATPGHTPEHLAFLVVDRGGGAVEPMGMLAGDFVFVGDLGRPDLLESAAGVAGAMEPAARRLWGSARVFLELPDWLQVWPGHGAGSACGKALGAVPTTTVGYERRYSPALAAVARGERPFVDFILAGQPEPPLYFARMKRLNREGAELLGELPAPRRLDADELTLFAGRSGAVVLDSRPDRFAFFERHLRGSLWTPLDRTFPTVVGSYVEPDEEIVLLVEEARRAEAVRDLVRIGLDSVVAWAPPELLAQIPAHASARIASIDITRIEERRHEPGVVVLDVRGRAEYEGGHLSGALQIAYTRLATRLDELPRDGELLVHCGGGQRAAAAAAYLSRRGLSARHVQGNLAELKSVLTTT